jgi:hypothetical protein
MSLVWEINFPTQTQKLTLLKLADHATDNGSSVFPGNNALSHQVGCDRRTIQRTIRQLEGAEIIKLTHRGGNGEGDTNRWQIDVDQLIKLATGEACLKSEDGCLQAVENKGGELPPSVFVRVTKALRRVTSGAALEGDTIVSPEPPSLTPLKKPNAGADARDGSRTAPRGNRPAIVITPSTDKSNWAAWMNLLRKEEKTGLIAAAERNGKMVVTSKWPNSEEGLRGLLEPKLADHTQRMLGEDAA